MDQSPTSSGGVGLFASLDNIDNLFFPSYHRQMEQCIGSTFCI
ncbi:hypothetical protein [Coleofasciculus sp. C1-SOL-03]